MFKNQLQELAQRSCFNLPSYFSIREGPDHAPRFKASVNFNGEIFESPCYCPTLRQAEHAAAEVALNLLSSKGPSRSLTARVLDETGIYKNLLQETAHRAGLNLPVYTTVRSGPGHVPNFTCTVELAGMSFTGEPAKTKKQAEKNAAISAWSSLKKMPNLDSLSNKESENHDQEQDQVAVAKVLSNFKPKDETKQVRRRDHHYHHQARRGMVKGFRENGSSSSGDHSLLHQRWRLFDVLSDSNSTMDCSSQKQNNFVSLLPPPPPRTTSKVLPPTTSNDSQAQFMIIRTQVFEQCSSSGNPVSMFKPVVKREPTPSPISNASNLFGTQNQVSGAQIGRNMYTGGFKFNRAPAVQIRTVIPVCAAPPPPIKADSSSSSVGSVIQPTQLSSELKKQQF